MRVLVVEDEVRQADALRRGLQADGFAVDVAANGTDGLWLATEQPYDAIILDLYQGTFDANDDPHHPHYGRAALERTRRALAPGGIFAVWTEEADPGFERSLQRAGFKVESIRPELEGPRHVVYLSPQGAPLDQAGLRRLGRCEHLVLLCGRYEGVDERLVATEVDEELSLGDFVLSGGELAAMAVIDGIVRLLPGALGHAQSAHEDSFTAGLLDCPHYTRPESLDGLEVPAVLLSGDHERIRRWRLKQSLGRTWQRRPELLQRLALGDEERALLAEFIRELADDDGAGRSSSRSSAS